METCANLRRIKSVDRSQGNFLLHDSMFFNRLTVRPF
jgi:hypothetical protein